MGTSYSILNVKETLALSERFIPRVIDFDPQNNYLNDVAIFVQSEQSALKASLGVTAGSAITEDIQSADTEHGTVSKNFRNLILVKKDLTVLPEESAASAKVFTVFEEFGHRVYDLPREQQVVLTDAMVEAFSTEEMLTAITTAGALPLFEVYKESHEKLKELIRQRVAENEAEAGEASSTLSRALGRTLNDIYEHVEQYARIGNSTYKELLAQLDIELSEIVPLAKARRTRLASAE